MIVNWFVHRLLVLQCFDLHTHEREVVFLRVECREACGLAASAVIGVVVVEANHSHHITDGSVAWLHVRAQSPQYAPEEGRLTTTRVCRDANDHGCLLKCFGGWHDWFHVIRPSVGWVQFDAVLLAKLGLGFWGRPHKARWYTFNLACHFF